MRRALRLYSVTHTWRPECSRFRRLLKPTPGALLPILQSERHRQSRSAPAPYALRLERLSVAELFRAECRKAGRPRRARLMRISSPSIKSACSPDI
ncbi:hypothetical protein SRHO_G00260630 [Serrasalmus rhombeus]